MTLLSNILKQKKIKLSLAVYPHPATLIYDDKIQARKNLE